MLTIIVPVFNEEEKPLKLEEPLILNDLHEEKYDPNQQQENAKKQTRVLNEIVSTILGKKRLPMLIVDEKKNIDNFKQFDAKTAAILGFSIFGKDFATKDGTTVRDFIHISDLSNVHYKFSKIIQKHKLKFIVNCGYGTGYSVLDVVNKFNSILDKKIKFNFKHKRKNEIEYSVADNKKIKKFIKLKTSRKKLFLMIKSSLDWYRNNYN